MPPEDIEIDITNPLERFFTLAGGVDHMESRSLHGVSIIQCVFSAGDQPGCGCHRVFQFSTGRPKTPAAGNIAAGSSEVRCLQLASCLVTSKAEGLNETELHDFAQF